MSNVQSAPLQKKQARSPHLVSQTWVIGLTIALLRVVAILLMIASTFGNYVQFVGGWDAISPISWVIVALAVAYQVICSVFQWGFKALRWWALYVFALIASAVPSFLTYNAWAGPYLAAQLGSVVGTGLIALAVIGADALPEWVLVK
jgi:hypothetical protein